MRCRRTLLLGVVVTALVASVPALADAQRMHRVRPGDTLAQIAKRHGVSVRSLQRVNRMRGDTIRPGQRLRLPSRRRRVRRSADGGRRGPQARPRRRRARSGTYRVRRGDSLARIARRFDVSVRALRRANRLRNNLIHPGQRLRIPGRGGGRQRPQGARPAELTDAQKRALRRAEQLQLDTVKVAHRLLTRPPKDAWVDAAGEREGDGTLAAPLAEGTLLRGWGTGANGYHLAIDIGADRGSEVLAAARGIVAYAGNQVRGYGNLVIVVHPNGWVTWYAHNRQNLVVPGQRVDRGEPIAVVGATGYAHSVHLHFMLQHEGEHCDALPLIRPEVTDREGEPAQAERARWTGERPESVRCLPRSARPHPRRRKGRRKGRRRRRGGR